MIDIKSVFSDEIFFSVIVEKPNQLCCNDMRTNRVGITVAGRSPVLQISVALLGHVPGDPDAAAPVGHPGTEVVDAGGLVQTSQSPLVVLR